MTVRLGVDLGGTKIEIVGLADDGSEPLRTRVATPDGYDGIIGAICELVGGASDALGDTHDTVGIGTPGAVSPVDGLMKNANSIVLNGRPFDEDLRRVLDRPMVMRNDADCFALSEARDGAGADAPVVFGVILGTGMGGGVVVDGKLLDGPNRISGEWGHNPLPWPEPDELPGADCYCGKRGCLETWLAGPSFARHHGIAGGADATAPEIVAAARRGDGAARHSLDRYVDRLARALATVINVLDPGVVVLGGGMSNVDEIYTEVPALLPHYVFGGEVATRVVPNVHGDSSGVRGAAMLVPV